MTWMPAFAGHDGGETTGCATAYFEINREERQIVVSLSELQRLSVAVIVDGRYGPTARGHVFVPRSSEEPQRIGQLVRNAIGFDGTRRWLWKPPRRRSPGPLLGQRRPVVYIFGPFKAS